MQGLLVVVVAAGCAGVAAAPTPPTAAAPPVTLGTPFAVGGEQMVYEVTLRGIHVARVQVAVGHPGVFEGKRAIIVKSHGETDGVLALLGELDWTLETTIDLEHGSPLLTVEDSVIKFNGETETNHDSDKLETHTVHSMITALRGWHSSPGQRGQIEFRIESAHIDVDVFEAGHDWVDRPAVRYEGIARDKFPFKIWLSDDTARVPLRLSTSTKWGVVGVELVEYTAPRD